MEHMEHIRGMEASQVSTLATNKLIRNTYTLLAMTLAFSAVTAGLSQALGLRALPFWLVLPVYFGLLFLTTKLRNSGWGILCVFLLTGFLGATLGPILSHFLATQHGAQLVMQAMGATAFIFFSLSAYVFISRKDFSFIGGFLFVGLLVAFLSGIAAIVFSLPTLSLAVSAAFVLLASGLILYQTSEIVHGRETNYIMATIALYVSLYNLFTSLLHLLAAFTGDD